MSASKEFNILFQTLLCFCYFLLILYFFLQKKLILLYFCFSFSLDLLYFQKDNLIRLVIKIILLALEKCCSYVTQWLPSVSYIMHIILCRNKITHSSTEGHGIFITPHNMPVWIYHCELTIRKKCIVKISTNFYITLIE